MPREKFLSGSEIAQKRAGYKRRTKAEKWGGNPTWYNDFARMGEEERKNFFYKIKNATSRRIRSIEREGVDSYSAYKLKKELEDTEKRHEERGLDRWKIGALLSKFHDFWSSLGSTKQGAIKINKEQDERIFGTKIVRGKKVLVHQMSHDEREKFWAAYMEFWHQNKSIPQTRTNSERIQRLLGSYILDFSPDELLGKLDQLLTDFNDITENTPRTAEEEETYRNVKRNLE